MHNGRSIWEIVKQMNKYQNETAKIMADMIGGQCPEFWLDYNNRKQQWLIDNSNKTLPLYFKIQFTEPNSCNKVIKNNMTIVICYDCILQKNSIICLECFDQSDHQGHIFQLVTNFKGCCDCGNQQLWDIKGTCINHSNKQSIQQLKAKVDQQELKRFVSTLSFGFAYFFLLYDQSQKLLLMVENPNYSYYVSKIQQVQQFGCLLMEYLCRFNKNSLISKLMTFDLLMRKYDFIKVDQSQLIFCQKPQQKSIVQIFLKCYKLKRTCASSIQMLFDMFSIKQFKRQLAILYFAQFNNNAKFASSDLSFDLGRQFVGSYYLIKDLVKSQEIQPLSYRPKIQDIKDFKQLRFNMIRYYKKINHLTFMDKQLSNQIYLDYHIKKGCLPDLNYYRRFTYRFYETKDFQNNKLIEYYDIQQKALYKLINIIRIVVKIPKEKSLIMIEKAIKDFFEEIVKVYSLNWNDLMQKIETDELSTKYAFIGHQISFSFLIFAYFQMLDIENINNEQKQLSLNQKITKLLQTLQINSFKQFEKQFKCMLKLVYNYITLAGICLGHQQTLNRFGQFSQINFGNNLMTLSLVFHLYKVLVRIMYEIKQEDEWFEYMTNFNGLNLFFRPKKQMQKVLIDYQLKSDNQSIFDRKKNMIRLSHFLNLIIQASQTDFHQTLLSNLLEMQAGQKYQKRKMKFYLQILKIYKSMKIKDFKDNLDYFFVCDEVLEKFLQTSKQIVINNGRISLKTQQNYFQSIQQTISKPQENNNQKMIAQNKPAIKIRSQMNLYYFKMLKYHIQTLNESQFQLVVPLSQNHFFHQIMSKHFIQELLSIMTTYYEKLCKSSKKVKQSQIGPLSQYIIEIVKIYKVYKFHYQQKQIRSTNTALTNTNHKQIQFKILKSLKFLKEANKYYNIFGQDLIRIIQQQIKEQSLNQSENDKIMDEGDDDDKNKNKILQKKRKMIAKKNKKLQKFKVNQKKCQELYNRQIKTIEKEELQKQKANISLVDEQQNNQKCIICSQGRLKTHSSTQNSNGSTQKNVSSSNYLNLMVQVSLSRFYNNFCKNNYQKEFNQLISKQIQVHKGNLAFTTCGHYIHDDCEKKIVRQIGFKYCQLCKTTYKCLFPIQILDLNKKMMAVKQEKKQVHLIVQSQLKVQIMESQQQNCQSKLIHLKNEPLNEQFENVLNRIIATMILLLYGQPPSQHETQQQMLEYNIQTVNKLVSIFVNQIILKLVVSTKYQCNQGKQYEIGFNQNKLKLYRILMIAMKMFVKKEIIQKCKQSKIKIVSKQNYNKQLLNNNQNKKTICLCFQGKTLELLDFVFISDNKQRQNDQPEQNHRQRTFSQEILEFGRQNQKQQIQSRKKQACKSCQFNNSNNQMQDESDKFDIEQYSQPLKCNQQHNLPSKFSQQLLLSKSPQQLLLMQNFIKQLTKGEIFPSSIEFKKQKNNLSNQCRMAILDIFNRIREGAEPSITGEKLRQTEKNNSVLALNLTPVKDIKQIQKLIPMIKFYVPPSNLKQLLKLRGRCPKCKKKTNHLQICLNNQLKQCKTCLRFDNYQNQNFYHSPLIYCCNFVYISTNLGEITYVSRGQINVQPSIYQDYFGYQVTNYQPTINLQKFVLNKERLNKIYKQMLNYQITAVIKYEKYKSYYNQQ